MIITAQSILKQKNFEQKKFSTNDFLAAVGEYFLANSVKSRLLLVSCRFVDVDLEQHPYSGLNPFGITEAEAEAGFKNDTAQNSKGELLFANMMWDMDFSMFQAQRQAGLIVPRFVIDKPFFENAAGLLRVMGGYVVEKRTVKRRKLYWVSLI